MKLFTSNISFDSITKTIYAPGYAYGSGFCKEQNRYNRKVKRIKFLGHTIFKYVMEYELVPSHVWLSMGALGYDDSGWTSKWSKEPNFRS